ncbi:hypothetical protein BCONGLO52_12680 [Brachybacterium conglomeratum]|uniref:Uncharacterized protein n=1 Tax=Brachybacterium conglomeratum TaxID=47846 RepID=A0ABQ5RG73_9MICO|nr:hypothetical protein BCONGLO52_12680 [Brachybacterium conglomeratum]GLK04966.1 hypothetical protein GCM10017597_17660 [Brachybacterium conglomeratum]
MDGGRVAVRLHDAAEDRDERAGRRGAVPGEERREEGGVRVCHALIVPYRPVGPGDVTRRGEETSGAL